MALLEGRPLAAGREQKPDPNPQRRVSVIFPLASMWPSHGLTEKLPDGEVASVSAVGDLV